MHLCKHCLYYNYSYSTLCIQPYGSSLLETSILVALSYPGGQEGYIVWWEVLFNPKLNNIFMVSISAASPCGDHNHIMDIATCRDLPYTIGDLDKTFERNANHRSIASDHAFNSVEAMVRARGYRWHLILLRCLDRHSQRWTTLSKRAILNDCPGSTF